MPRFGNQTGHSLVSRFGNHTAWCRASASILTSQHRPMHRNKSYHMLRTSGGEGSALTGGRSRFSALHLRRPLHLGLQLRNLSLVLLPLALPFLFDLLDLPLEGFLVWRRCGHLGEWCTLSKSRFGLVFNRCKCVEKIF